MGRDVASRLCPGQAQMWVDYLCLSFFMRPPSKLVVFLVVSLLNQPQKGYLKVRIRPIDRFDSDSDVFFPPLGALVRRSCGAARLAQKTAAGSNSAGAGGVGVGVGRQRPGGSKGDGSRRVSRSPSNWCPFSPFLLWVGRVPRLKLEDLVVDNLQQQKGGESGFAVYLGFVFLFRFCSRPRCHGT